MMPSQPMRPPCSTLPPRVRRKSNLPGESAGPDESGPREPFFPSGRGRQRTRILVFEGVRS